LYEDALASFINGRNYEDERDWEHCDAATLKTRRQPNFEEEKRWMLNLEPLNPRFIDGQHTGEDDAAHYTTDEESDLYSGRARNVVDDTLDQTSSDESEPDSPEPREFVPETPLPLRLPTTLRSSSPGRDWEDEPVSRAQKRPSADRWSSDDDSDKENRPPKRRSVAKKLSKYFR